MINDIFVYLLVTFAQQCTQSIVMEPIAAELSGDDGFKENKLGGRS